MSPKFKFLPCALIVFSALMSASIPCRADSESADGEYIGVAGAVMGPMVGTGTEVLDSEKSTSEDEVKAQAGVQGIRQVMEIPASGKFRLVMERADTPLVDKGKNQAPSGLKLLDPGKNAKLVNQAGKVLYDASEGEAPLLSVKESTDGSMMLLDSGERGTAIYSAEPFKKVGTLPAKAPVLDGKGFKWEWYDDSRLLGISSTNAGTGPDDDRASRKTEVYVYDVKKNLLIPVDEKDSEIPNFFEVRKWKEGGHFMIEADTDGKGSRQRWISVKE